MGQIKKPHVKEAILSSATELFRAVGYHETTLPAIARGAGVSTSNVYVYFTSKLEILYDIYEPWMRARLARLERDLEAMISPRERLFLLLRTFWRDIPAEEGGFANNIIQAISTAQAGQGYRPTLLNWIEDRLSEMLLRCLPPARRRLFAHADAGHFLVMVFDGYAMYHHLNPSRPLDDATLALLCDLLLGRLTSRASRRADGELPRRPAPRSKGKSATSPSRT